MTRTGTLIVTILATTTLCAQYTPPDPSGMQGLIVEKYYIADVNDAADTDGGSGLVAGATTYRVFVDLKPGYKLVTVGGFPDHPITMGTSTTFFNNDDRGDAWGNAINDIHLDVNTVAIDSWLTIGGASDAHWGVLKTEDPDGSTAGILENDGGSTGTPLLVNDVPEMGIPLTTADGLWAAGSAPPSINAVGTPPDLFESGGSNSYSNDNYAWSVLGGTGSPDTANRILVGQFTTDGVLNLCLNFFVGIPDSLVCPDPACFDFMVFYGNLLPSDTAGASTANDNIFTHPTLCYDSSVQQPDCEGVIGGTALPGTSCDDGNPDTSEDVYTQNCDCVGEDCLGVLGGTALPGQPCDDENPNTQGDTWQSGCLCEGTVGLNETGAAGIGVRVHPNPARELVSIELEGMNGERISYALRNALGSAITRTDLGVLNGTWKGTIDLSGAASGVYFLEITSGTTKYVERIVKL